MKMNNDEAVVKSKSIGLNQSAKSLLRNVIRHTDTHNRHKEESEMWNLYSKIKSNENSDDDSRRGKDRRNRGDERKYFKDQDVQNSFLYDDREEMESRRRGVKRAHMDDANEGRTEKTKSGGESTYWLRQLHEFEAADPDRWGHSGFKELYPEIYDSDQSSPGANTSPSKSRSHKKRKNKKSKKEKDEPHSKKKKKKRRKRESDKEGPVDVEQERKRKYSRAEFHNPRGDDKHSSRGRKREDTSDNDGKVRDKTRTKSIKRKKRKRYSKVENEKDRMNDGDRDSWLFV